MKKLFLILLISHGLVTDMEANEKIALPSSFHQLDRLAASDKVIEFCIRQYQNRDKQCLHDILALSMYELSKLDKEYDEQNLVTWSKRFHISDILLEQMRNPSPTYDISGYRFQDRYDRYRQQAVRLLLIANKDQGSCFSWLPRELVKEIGILVKNGFAFKPIVLKPKTPLVVNQTLASQFSSTTAKSSKKQSRQKIALLRQFFSKMAAGTVAIVAVCYGIARYKNKNRDEDQEVDRAPDQKNDQEKLRYGGWELVIH